MNPPVPTKLKLLRGTQRADRANHNEPQPTQEIPPVPAHLSDEAKVEWGRVSQELATLGLLTRLDRAALAAYCDCWSDYVDASRLCASHAGPDGKPLDRKVIKTRDGNLVENPYYSIKKRSLELMHKFLTGFGMDPSSRTRINAAPAEQEKPSTWKGFGSKKA